MYIYVHVYNANNVMTIPARAASIVLKTYRICDIGILT